MMRKFEYEDVFTKDIATHVVTGMVFGADAFFVFDREVEGRENIKDVHRSLKIKVGGLPGKRAIEKEGSVNIDSDEEKVQCRLYVETLSYQQYPATFRDAAKVYQELPELLQRKSFPKSILTVSSCLL